MNPGWSVGLFLLLAGFACAQPTVPGSVAPELHLDSLLPLRPVSEVSLASLRGKVVVVEFWATWCAPCIAAMPHFNQLAEQFRNRPIQFISVTDEDRVVVERFLKKRPIGGWIGFDSTRRTFDTYGVNGIPQTIVIDGVGRVQAVINPEQLTARQLEDCLAGKAVLAPAPVVGIPAPREKGLQEMPAPLLDILIRPSISKSEGLRRDNKSFSGEGLSLTSLLSNVFGYPSYRLRGTALENSNHYDISVSLPARTNAGLQAFLQEIVVTAFHLKATREMRDTDVVVLSAPRGKSQALAETVSNGGAMVKSGAGQMKCIGLRLDDLSQNIGNVIHQDVVNETGLNGQYDFELKWDGSKPESLLESVRDHLGLTVERTRRSIEFLVVNKAE